MEQNHQKTAMDPVPFAVDTILWSFDEYTDTGTRADNERNSPLISEYILMPVFFGIS